jgi:hypothetical protein
METIIMSSSIHGSSALHMALLNQLLQRVGVDQDAADANAPIDASTTSQADGDSASFNTQTDALFNTLDSDGEGKLSKSEFRTGFQKLSQDMRSVLIGQQNISGDDSAGTTGTSSAAEANSTSSAFGSLDTDDDDSISQGEFSTGTGAARLLDSLLQSAGSNSDRIAPGNASTSAASSATDTATGTSNIGGGNISDDEWAKLLKNLQNSAPGDIANVPAMMRLRQSTNLHAAVTDLLQATDTQQGNASTAATSA